MDYAQLIKLYGQAPDGPQRCYRLAKRNGSTDQRVLEKGREPRYAVALHMMYYNFVRIDKTLATAAGASTKLGRSVTLHRWSRTLGRHSGSVGLTGKKRPWSRNTKLAALIAACSFLPVDRAVPGSLSLEEAIAGLYGNKPSDLHRLDGRTVENKAGEQQYYRGDNNCTGGVRPSHFKELSLPPNPELGKEYDEKDLAVVPDSVATRQEFHFDEVLPAEIKIEKVAADLPGVKAVLIGLPYAHVGCSFYKSGRSDCDRSWVFYGSPLVEAQENRQVLLNSVREIFMDLCPAKR